MADLAALPVPSMDWHSSDAPQTFKKFKALCELILSGPLKDKSEEEKVKYLLIWSGEEGIELVSTWNLGDAESKLLNTYWTKFQDYVTPKSNFRLSRYKLRSLKQGASEPVDAFIRKVRVLVSECKYQNSNEHIIDALVFGSNSQRVQTKLMQKDDTLTLDAALDIARTEEAAQQQVQGMAGGANQIHTLQNTARSRGRKTRCGRCGLDHPPEQTDCPAWGDKCRGCGGFNHWQNMCRTPKRRDEVRPRKEHNPKGKSGQNNPAPQQKQQPQAEAPANKGSKQHSTRRRRDRQHKVHTMCEQDTENLYFDCLELNSLTGVQQQSTQAITTIEIESKVCRKMCKCKLDTGAEGNVIPVSTYKRLCPRSSVNEFGVPSDLKPSSTRITAYGGTTVQHYGTCSLTLHHRRQRLRCSFHVVNTTGPIILGLPTCQSLGLVTLNYSLNIGDAEDDAPPDPQPSYKPQGNAAAKTSLLAEFPECFEGIGCFEGEYRITLDPTVPPVVHPPRRVPVALQEPLKKELDRLVEAGIIAKVDRPTDWVNSFVCATKSNGSIRLCLDPKDLNAAIKRPHHFTPTLDDVLPKLNGAKYFTILDARSGYWNIRLEEDSSYYTTFNTPFGRFRFLRLPFGLVCAQDVFQKKIDETYGDLPGVTGIADDIVVTGVKEDGSDHDENLRRVMERTKSKGLTLNADKVIVKCTSIPFYGNVIGADGLAPDPRKVEAITSMTEPTTVKELQTFLGMVNYLSRFTPNLSALTTPLRALCRKDVTFSWGPEHQLAFNNVKDTIASPTVLKYFDSSKPVTIQVDASLRGLGAVLLQESGPVAYASKALSETEERYSNIEREMLGLVFGLERFHYYAYGRPVNVETDHKPLEAIASKNLVRAPPRIARMLLRIQKYDVKIKYVPGRDIPMADALSRVNPLKGDHIKGLDISIHEMYLHLNASPARIEQIKEETAKDTTLMALCEVITKGWPDRRAECPSHLHDYWNYRDELSMVDGMVIKDTRLVIPKALRQDCLDQIHYAHQGAEKCKLRAKGSVFWAGINKDIEEMVRQCPPCQRHQAEQTKEPLMPHDVPRKAWDTLGSDLFWWNSSHYLLIVDYYSKFPIIRKLKDIKSSTIITHLKSVFEEHGIPEKLVSDNGTQYTSQEFEKFSKDYGFVHETSSPLYPRSNGLSERNVQTIKRLLQKCKECGADPHMAMLCLRSTPIDHHLPSPAELLNGRSFKSNLPAVSRGQLGDIPTILQDRQDRQKSRHDTTTRQLDPVKPGQSVRVQNQTTHVWEPAVVVDVAAAPRSYIISKEDGTTLRRNRRHLRQTGETFHKTSVKSAGNVDSQPTSEPSTAGPCPSNTPTKVATPDKLSPVSVAKPSPSKIPLRRSSRSVVAPKKLDL